MRDALPRAPESLDPLAREILERLRRSHHAGDFIIGGHLALKHYLDFRPTHDIDAWWTSGPNTEALEELRGILREVAAKRGLEVNERRWADVVSLELIEREQKIFTVQIATRTIELSPPLDEPWGPLLLESIKDNVGSKMNALVARGAPRDFIDIRQVVAAQLCSPQECWNLWMRKNPGKDVEQARSHVLRHLESITLRRPLEQIEDKKERETARELRNWFREIFTAKNHDRS